MKHVTWRKAVVGGLVTVVAAVGATLALASSSVQLPFSGTYHGHTSTTTAQAVTVIPTGFDGSDPACSWTVDGAGNLGLTIATIPQGGSVACRTAISYQNTGQAALVLQDFMVTGTLGTVNGYTEPATNPAGCGLLVQAGATSPSVALEVIISGVPNDSTGTLTGQVDLATTGTYTAASCTVAPGGQF